MISLEDLVAFSDLRADEVQAIAEHEHMPASMAAAFGRSLMQAEDGTGQIRDILIGAMRTAVRRRDVPQARRLASTLRGFLHEHPEARTRRAAA